MKQRVKHSVGRVTRLADGGFLNWLRGSDEGSGTISGIALIAVAAVMLGVVGVVGNLLLCLHRAQNIADISAVAAATVLYEQSAEPCSIAERTASGNGAMLASCEVDGEDVQVDIRVGTQVPFAPNVVRQSRAGPIACD